MDEDKSLKSVFALDWPVLDLSGLGAEATLRQLEAFAPVASSR